MIWISNIYISIYIEINIQMESRVVVITILIIMVEIIMMEGIKKDIIKIISNIVIIFKTIYLKYYKELLMLNNY